MEKYRICPKCKSKDVKLDWRTGIIGLTAIDKFICNKCGYTSAFFPEIDEE